MRGLTRTSVLVTCLVCVTGIASAQFEEPSHPLSQIEPIDVALNMSNEQVLNISVLSLSNPEGDGFNLDNYVISDVSNTNRLKLAPSEDEFRIQGSELNLSSNNLTAPNNIKTGGEDIEFRDSANGLDVLRLKEGGNISVPSGKANFSGGEVIVHEDNLTVGDRRITVGRRTTSPYIEFEEEGAEKARIQRISPESALQVRQNGYENSLEIRDGKLKVAGDNINLSGNNITSIDTLKFVEGTSIDGDLTINGSANITQQLNASKDLDLKDTDLKDVRNITGGGDAVEFQDSIDLKENAVLNLDRLRDNTGTDTLRFDGSSNVEIPNGDLDLGTNNLTGVQQIEFSNQQRITLGTREAGFGSGEDSIALGNSIRTGDDTVGIGDNLEVQGSRSIVIGNDGRALSGDNRVVAIGDSVDATSSNSVVVGSSAEVQGSGVEGSVVIGESAEAMDGTGVVLGQEAVTGDENAIAIGQNSNATKNNAIAIGQNSNATKNNAIAIGKNVNADTAGTIRLGGTRPNSPNDVEIPNGNLKMNGNDIVTNRDQNMRVETERSLVLGGNSDSEGAGQVAIQTNGTSRVFVNREGQLEVQDNDLDLQGNRVVDDTSSNEVFIGDGNNDNVRLETGTEDVDVPSGDIDVGGDNVKEVNRVDFSNDEEIEEKNGDLCIGDRCA